MCEHAPLGTEDNGGIAGLEQSMAWGFEIFLSWYQCILRLLITSYEVFR